jgi:hypothetical protein
MSTSILRLIPADPQYTPNSEAQAQARELLSPFVENTACVSARVTDNVEFIDQGSNFEQLRCPLCHIDLDLACWQEAMDAAYETLFTELTCHLPCCCQQISLNDLLYDWPAGFARFVLDIHNPTSQVDAVSITLLEQTLGCKLRVIQAHY